jgi:hypothetical protein
MRIRIPKKIHYQSSKVSISTSLTPKPPSIYYPQMDRRQKADGTSDKQVDCDKAVHEYHMVMRATMEEECTSSGHRLSRVIHAVYLYVYEY